MIFHSKSGVSSSDGVPQFLHDFELVPCVGYVCGLSRTMFVASTREPWVSHLISLARLRLSG